MQIKRDRGLAAQIATIEIAALVLAFHWGQSHFESQNCIATRWHRIDPIGAFDLGHEDLVTPAHGH